MAIVAPFTNWIRTFGCTHGLDQAGPIAHNMGLNSAIGIWIGKDLAANDREIACGVASALNGYADMIIVGSEVLLRGDVSEQQLVAYLQSVRQQIPSNIPVTTADVYGVLLQHPTLIQASDVVMGNFYQYWEGYSINTAVGGLHATYKQLTAAANGKTVIVSETGWPSAGNAVGAAVPSPANAAAYFLNFVSWARANNVEYFYFETTDEAWKVQYEGPQGGAWGVWDHLGNLKPGMQAVFDGQTVPDNWSGSEIPGGPGTPSIALAFVGPYNDTRPVYGSVLHVKPSDYKVAIYILVGQGWWTKPTFAQPLTAIQTDGTFFANIVTGGIDQQATRVRAYLVPNGYNPPVAAGSSSLPTELNQYPVAEVLRGSDSICGRVLDSGSGFGLPGVAISLTGAVSLTVQTVATGEYCFPNLSHNATYTVTPSKQYYGLSPSSQTVANLSGHATADFSATGTPGPASVPFPSNGAANISTGVTLGWMISGSVASNDVSLSTSNPPTVVANTTTNTFTPSTLQPSTTYYWQIVSKNSAGTASSPIWSFTTVQLSVPSVVSMTPNSGSGSSQTFSFVFSDLNGFTDLSTTYMGFNSSFAFSGGCFSYYDRNSNLLWLLNDASNGWLGPVTPGAAGALQNSQCTLNGAGSSVTGSGNNLTVNVALTFKAPFGGAKNVYMCALDNGGLSSNWQQRGTWTVPNPNNLPPAAVSVGPSSGSGSSQTFTFVFSDPDGFTDLSTTYMGFSPTFAFGNACYSYYDRNLNALWLLNDASNGWLGPVTPGAAGTLQNSQCTLNGAGSSVSGLGNNLTINVALTFKTVFGGAKNVYMCALDNGGLSSNWQQRGTWTVPNPNNLPPAAVSVGPSSGSGSSQTFTFVFSDPNGFTDLSTTYMGFSPTFAFGNACYSYYDRNLNALWLLNDASNGWLGPVTPGAAGTLQNSQCTLNGAGSSVSGLANNLTINVALTFKTVFGGAKNVYMCALDNSGASSNWQQLGAWTAQ